ncbi:MAG: hypothetical protein KJ064_11590 [Anaerolineae bacterium]|nr:MAG: hypothetical protein F9K27_00770 [Anaerolineae bacterium]MCL4877295.1 hypothetical protein [Anaerolineae bacterium]
MVKERVNDFVSRLGVVGELLVFLWRAKMWWLIPMVVALLLFAILIVVANAGPAGPMIYTLF